MNKLTAKKCCQLLDTLNSNGMSILEGYYAEALEIALPILEQQELMIDPSFYVVYHPNPNPSVNDDKEYCECGSIHLARKLAAKIGGTIRPVYVGPKMEQPERATNQNGEQ